MFIYTIRDIFVLAVLAIFGVLFLYLASMTGIDVLKRKWRKRK